MVSRSLRNLWLVPSASSTLPTRPRIASKACGQSSSAPSSSPIRWSGIGASFRLTVEHFQADALVVLALALGAGDAHRAHLGGREHVGAAVGLLVQADDVDD